MLSAAQPMADLTCCLLQCHDSPQRYTTGHVCTDQCLFAEIVEFCRFLEPTAEEAAAREAATQRVRQAIIELYANASVQVFGSLVTGQLALPCTNQLLAEV